MLPHRVLRLALPILSPIFENAAVYLKGAFRFKLWKVTYLSLRLPLFSPKKHKAVHDLTIEACELRFKLIPLEVTECGLHGLTSHPKELDLCSQKIKT